MERAFLDACLSLPELTGLKDALVKAEHLYIEQSFDFFSSGWFFYMLIKRGEDLEDKGNIFKLKLVLVSPNEDDLEMISDQSEALIVEKLCPYLEERATRVKSLEVSSIKNPRVVDALVRAFRRNRLASLSIVDCADFLGTSNVDEVKESFRRLKSIALYDIHLSSTSQVKLVECLSETKTLTEASFEFVPFHRHGLRSLIGRLANNKDLESLKLEHCCQHSRDAKSLRRLGRLVTELPRLRDVDLSDNQLSDQRLATFLSELVENDTAFKLILFGNSMGVRSSRILGTILHDRDTVVELDLPFLSDDTAVILCDGLRDNTSLEKFEIFGTIDSRGATAIGQMLQQNEAISKLLVRSRELSRDFFGLVCHGLETNSTVTEFEIYLHLGMCDLTDYEALARVISRNDTLKLFALEHGGAMTRTMASALSAALAENTTLECLMMQPIRFESGSARNIYVNGLLSNMTIKEIGTLPGLPSRATIYVNGNMVPSALTRRHEELLDIHLRLNRFGRRHLVDPGLPLELWPWILEKANHGRDGVSMSEWGIDVLWYVVRNRPEVYDVAGRH